MFAFSFFKPASARDWRSFGAFTAFIVALFVEMYGFPLTIYFLSGWLGQKFPGVDLLSHSAGHLLELQFGWVAILTLGLSIFSATCSLAAASGCWPRPGPCSTRPSGRGGWLKPAFMRGCGIRSTSPSS